MKNAGAVFRLIDDADETVDAVYELSRPRFRALRSLGDSLSNSDFGHTSGTTCGGLPRL